MLPPRIAEIARLRFSQAPHTRSWSRVVDGPKVAFDLSLPTRYAGLVDAAMLDGPRRTLLRRRSSSGDAAILVALAIGRPSSWDLLRNLLNRRHCVGLLRLRGRLRSRFETACFAKDGDELSLSTDTFAGKQGTTLCSRDAGRARVGITCDSCRRRSGVRA